MGYYIIKEPKFFREFQCAGASCESNCCCDWEDLIWLNEEYERLCSLDLPDKTRENIKSAFCRLEIPEIDEPLWNLRLSGKKCPFLADNSLCSIQREFGEEFISNTCRIYPRVSVFNNAVMTRGCYASCPEVAKTLLNDPFALEMCVRQVQVAGDLIELNAVLCEGDEDFRQYPALRFRNELFGLFYDVLSAPKHTVEENLLIGLDIAKTISEAEDPEEIPELIGRVQMRLKKSDPKSDNDMQFGKAFALFTEIFGKNSAVAAVISDRKPDPEKIAEGASLFPPYFFKNLALNFLFELKMPFYFADKNVYENYSFFLSVYSMAKLLISAGALEGGTELALERLSEFDRGIVHDKIVSEKVLKCSYL